MGHKRPLFAFEYPRLGAGREGFRDVRWGPDTSHSGSTRPLRGFAPPCPPQRLQPRRAPSLTHHGEVRVSGVLGSRFLRRRQQAADRASPRVRASTQYPQRSPRPPPPAPTVPQRPSRAPRLARPRPARPTCYRTAAPADPSAPFFVPLGPRIFRSHPVQSRGLPPATRARTRGGTTFRRRAPHSLWPQHFPPWRRGTLGGA